MQIKTYYSKSKKIWFAFLENDNGNQIGNAEFAPSKELAAFWLGVQYAKKRNKDEIQSV